VTPVAIRGADRHVHRPGRRPHREPLDGAMSYQVDKNGRYRFPMLETDTVRVVADCSSGWGMDGPERVWDGLSDRHAYAHNKGLDGLSAAGRMEIQRITAGPTEPEPEAEAGL
jgi:hypothetical protein